MSEIKTARQLQRELIVVSETTANYATKLFSLALATLINENVPLDRTMLRVKQRALAKELPQ